MIRQILGRKIGMTQVFSANNGGKVIPVTAISIEQAFVLQIKIVEHDGYNAVQVGLLRSKYRTLPFSLEWLKNKKKYFCVVKELAVGDISSFIVGDMLNTEDFCSVGQILSVTGVTIGKGFQGTVKRYKFTGGRGSHGDKLGRGPGSLSGLRTQGRVFKGKKMPGHMGCIKKTISGLTVVDYYKNDRVLLISGPVAGRSGGILMLSGGGK